MIVVSSITQLRQEVRKCKDKGKTIGFVPTMGALHKGHLSLMGRAQEEQDILVVSIFVNPLQFGPGEDYEDYPRVLDRDIELLKEQRADILFAPSVNEMYPKRLSTTVKIDSGTDVLCGRSRPGHFDGAATVVLKLFHLVEPDTAYFGQKDAQQVAVIKNMVDDFNLPVKIVACETVREKDGLAVSSRNKNLTEHERSEAVFLQKSLKRAVQLAKEGVVDTVILQEEIKKYLQTNTSAEVDYVEVLSFPSLRKVKRAAGSIILAGAIQFSKARLIDNVIANVAQERQDQEEGEAECIVL